MNSNLDFSENFNKKDFKNQQNQDVNINLSKFNSLDEQIISKDKISSYIKTDEDEIDS